MAAGKSKGEPIVSKTAAVAAYAASAADAKDAKHTLRRMVRLIESDGRYPLDAYRFLQEGLEHTVRQVHGESVWQQHQKAGLEDVRPEPAHVGGADLCLGLGKLAVARWGRLSRLVLNSWGVYATRDFGEMVFLLVNNGFLQKTDADTIDDFVGVYALADLERQYRVSFDRGGEDAA